MRVHGSAQHFIPHPGVTSLWCCYFGGRGLKSLGTPDLVNHEHFRLVSSTKVKIDLVIVFIFKDPFSSRLSLVLVMGKRLLTKLTLLQTALQQWHMPPNSLVTETDATKQRWELPWQVP